MRTLLQQSYRIQTFNHSRRLFFAWLFLLFLYLALILRLVDLQCIHGGEMYRRGQDNQLSLASLSPQRGKIYDRNHRIIAENRAVFHLDINIQKNLALDDILLDVSNRIPRSDDYSKQALVKARETKNNRRIRLYDHLTSSEIDQATFLLQDHPALELTTEFSRYYPCGSACASVTGYVKTEKNTTHKKTRHQTAFIPMYHGVNGIERQYQEALQGKKGLQQYHRNAQGKMIFEDITLPALHGDDLVLSIDLRLQEMIAKRMGKLRGSVVMINPKNGEILALHSSPSYDPNLFLSPESAFKLLFKDPDQPLFNRAIAGLFPPASTIKPFLVVEALQSRKITTNYQIFDPGFYRYGNSDWVYHNWWKAGHKDVNPRKAIILSNDTFFYHLSVLLGIDQISDMLSHWGFGNKTFIDIPGENIGLIPSREWKENRGETWLVGDTIITGIGQGAMLATPLQIVHALSTLANQGKGFTPHVLVSQEHPSGKVDHHVPQPLPPVKLDPKLWNYVVEAMGEVTTSGTGRRFGAFSWPVAAKTGTAQVARHSGKDKKYAKKLQDHTMFALFTPTKNPEVALIVLLEHNRNATLLARGIMDDYLSLKKKQG